MSVIIRLQGLSWSSSAMDVRNFFHGLTIPPGGVHIIGGEKGDAFIAFSTDEDARQAMMKSTGVINESPIQLFLSSKTEMQNTITEAKQQSIAGVVTPNPSAAPPSKPAAVLASGYPTSGMYNASVQQQQQQVGQYPNIYPSGIHSESSSLKSEKPSNTVEHDLPGEYSVGGIPQHHQNYQESALQYTPYGNQEYASGQGIHQAQHAPNRDVNQHQAIGTHGQQDWDNTKPQRQTFPQQQWMESQKNDFQKPNINNTTSYPPKQNLTQGQGVAFSDQQNVKPFEQYAMGSQPALNLTNASPTVNVPPLMADKGVHTGLNVVNVERQTHHQNVLQSSINHAIDKEAQQKSGFPHPGMDKKDMSINVPQSSAPITDPNVHQHVKVATELKEKSIKETQGGFGKFGPSISEFPSNDGVDSSNKSKSDTIVDRTDDKERKDRDRDKERDSDRRDRRDRDRDDDRRRRDRDRSRDRDRGDRDRDRSRRSREKDRRRDNDRRSSPKGSPAHGRTSRKRSLSPSSQNKLENDKKQQIQTSNDIQLNTVSAQHLFPPTSITQPSFPISTPVCAHQPLIGKPLFPSAEVKASPMGNQFGVSVGLLGSAPPGFPIIGETPLSINNTRDEKGRTQDGNMEWVVPPPDADDLHFEMHDKTNDRMAEIGGPTGNEITELPWENMRRNEMSEPPTFDKRYEIPPQPDRFGHEIQGTPTLDRREHGIGRNFDRRGNEMGAPPHFDRRGNGMDGSPSLDIRRNDMVGPRRLGGHGNEMSGPPDFGRQGIDMEGRPALNIRHEMGGPPNFDRRGDQMASDFDRHRREIGVPPEIERIGQEIGGPPELDRRGNVMGGPPNVDRHGYEHETPPFVDRPGQEMGGPPGWDRRGNEIGGPPCIDRRGPEMGGPPGMDMGRPEIGGPPGMDRRGPEMGGPPGMDRRGPEIGGPPGMDRRGPEMGGGPPGWNRRGNEMGGPPGMDRSGPEIGGPPGMERRGPEMGGPPRWDRRGNEMGGPPGMDRRRPEIGGPPGMDRRGPDIGGPPGIDRRGPEMEGRQPGWDRRGNEIGGPPGMDRSGPEIGGPPGMDRRGPEMGGPPGWDRRGNEIGGPPGMDRSRPEIGGPPGMDRRGPEIGGPPGMDRRGEIGGPPGIDRRGPEIGGPPGMDRRGPEVGGPPGMDRRGPEFGGPPNMDRRGPKFGGPPGIEQRGPEIGGPPGMDMGRPEIRGPPEWDRRGNEMGAPPCEDRRERNMGGPPGMEMGSPSGMDRRGNEMGRLPEQGNDFRAHSGGGRRASEMGMPGRFDRGGNEIESPGRWTDMEGRPISELQGNEIGGRFRETGVQLSIDRPAHAMGGSTLPEHDGFEHRERDVRGRHRNEGSQMFDRGRNEFHGPHAIEKKERDKPLLPLPDRRGSEMDNQLGPERRANDVHIGRRNDDMYETSRRNKRMDGVRGSADWREEDQNGRRWNEGMDDRRSRQDFEDERQIEDRRSREHDTWPVGHGETRNFRDRREDSRDSNFQREGGRGRGRYDNRGRSPVRERNFSDRDRGSPNTRGRKLDSGHERALDKSSEERQQQNIPSLLHDVFKKPSSLTTEKGPNSREHTDNKSENKREHSIDKSDKSTCKRERLEKEVKHSDIKRSSNNKTDIDTSTKNKSERTILDTANKNRTEIEKNKTTTDTKKENRLQEKHVSNTKKDVIDSQPHEIHAVHLFGLELNKNYRDIRKFLVASEIPRDGIKIINDAKGNRTGEAYVKFSNKESYTRALALDRKFCGINKILVCSCSIKDFDTAIDSYRPDDDSAEQEKKANDKANEFKVAAPLSTSSFVVNKPKEFIVKVSNLSNNINPSKLKSMFIGCIIARNGDAVYIDMNKNRQCVSGIAFIEFKNAKSFGNALQVTKSIDRKDVLVRPSTRDELQSIIEKNKAINPKQYEQYMTEMKKPNTPSSDNKKIEKEVVTTHIKVEKSNTVANQDKLKTDKHTTAITQEKTVKTEDKAQSTEHKYTCMQITNLPLSFNTRDLRAVFDGFEIAPRGIQVCHDAVGKPLGEGYVNFTTSECAHKAMKQRDGLILGRCKISCKFIKVEDMIQNCRVSRQSLVPEAPSKQAVFFYVKASTLPKNVSIGEIMNFFHGCRPAPESMRLNIGDSSDGTDSSTALIGFWSKEDAELAISNTCGKKLRSNVPQLTKVIV